MKDLFSNNSQLYQQARPSYPQSVIVEILKHVETTQLAWDCGAGSGQFTQLLSPYFEKVFATDLSAQQLQQASHFENVCYRVECAEQTYFPDHCFDLITVAQAIHWFDFDRFYKEVKRTLKPTGIFAAIGYGVLTIDDEKINALIQDLYFQTLKNYWDVERRYIDEAYQTIPFPFVEISTPKLEMSYAWRTTQLLNYLNTWSALKHYKNQNLNDPLASLGEELRQSDQLLNIKFPVFLRIGHL